MHLLGSCRNLGIAPGTDIVPETGSKSVPHHYKEQHIRTLAIPCALIILSFFNSLLDIDLKCLRALYDQFSNWTHAMTLAGSELPVHPISHIERTVELALPGSRSYAQSKPIDSPGQEGVRKRMQWVHRLRDRSQDTDWTKWLASSFGEDPDFGEHPVIPETDYDELKGPPPYGLTVYKGLKFGILSRYELEETFQRVIKTNFPAPETSYISLSTTRCLSAFATG